MANVQEPARKENHAVTALMLAGILACGAAASWWLRYHTGGSPQAAPPPASAPAAQASASSAASACTLKTPGPGIYVREVTPGAQPAADAEGGWEWDYNTGECLSAVAYALKTALPMNGDCTTVAYQSDNLGYDPGAVPAPPLEHVIGSAGPGC